MLKPEPARATPLIGVRARGGTGVTLVEILVLAPHAPSSTRPVMGIGKDKDVGMGKGTDTETA